MTYSLALDLGGTFIKGAVLDLARGTLVHVETAPFPPFLPPSAPGRREVAPAALVAAAEAMIDALLAAAPAARSLFLCGQMHGLVLVGPDGAAIGPASTWQDARALQPGPAGRPSYEALVDALGPTDLEALGEMPAAGCPLAVLHHHRHAGTLPAGAAPLGLAAHVACRLAGVAPACDPTDAAAAGAADLRAGGWHAGLLARLGLDALAWPAIVPGGAPLGEYRHGGRALTVHAPIGDQQAALLGALLGPDELSVNVGTGSQVSRRLAAPTAGDYQLRPHADGAWLATVTHLPAGRALNVLFRLVTELGGGAHDEAAAWAVIEARARAAAPSGLRAELSFFPGRLGQQGALTGITEEHFAVGDLFRAAYATMAENYAAAARRVDPGGATRGAVLSGGLGHRAGLLAELVGGHLQVPVRRSLCAEETLYGLLVLASARLGLDGSVEAARARLAGRGLDA